MHLTLLGIGYFYISRNILEFCFFGTVKLLVTVWSFQVLLLRFGRWNQGYFLVWGQCSPYWGNNLWSTPASALWTFSFSSLAVGTGTIPTLCECRILRSLSFHVVLPLVSCSFLTHLYWFPWIPGLGWGGPSADLQMSMCSFLFGTLSVLVNSSCLCLSRLSGPSPQLRAPGFMWVSLPALQPGTSLKAVNWGIPDTDLIYFPFVHVYFLMIDIFYSVLTSYGRVNPCYSIWPEANAILFHFI